jgi:hypothetical protein
MKLLIELSNKRILLLHSNPELLELGNDSITMPPVLLHLIQQPIHLSLVPLHLCYHKLALSQLCLSLRKHLRTPYA